MSIRLMTSPPFLTTGGGYIAKAEQYCTGSRSFFPTKLDGTPASTWVLTWGRATDWTAADADVDVNMVFSHPSDIVATCRAGWRTQTLGDLPAAERTRVLALFDTLGVQRADFDATTPIWRLVRRLMGRMVEREDGFAAGDNF